MCVYMFLYICLFLLLLFQNLYIWLVLLIVSLFWCDYLFFTVGWGCFEMGFGRKIDPEPGRCRRTDGKKWRCSKEAYPDSKYCEKHMHRGRNRSRKPVEVPSSTSSIISNTSQAIPSSYSSFNRGLSMMSSNPNNHNHYNNNNASSSISSSSLPFASDSSSQYPYYHNSSLNPYFYTHSSSSSRPPDSDFSASHTNSTTHQLFLDSGSYSHDEKDYRFVQNKKVGNFVFFFSL